MPLRLDRDYVGTTSVTINKGMYYIEWEIEGFFFYKPNYDLYFTSERFRLWEEDWRFKLCQNGRQDIENNLCFRLLSSEAIHDIQAVTFTSGIKKEDGTVYKSSEPQTVTTTSFESSTLVKRSELEHSRPEIAPNGHLTFYVEVFLQEDTGVEGTINIPQAVSTKDVGTVVNKEKIELFDSNDVAVLTESLKNLYLNEHNSDVTIMVGENEFKAHKTILAARSTVFASMFEHDMKESRSGIINIPDCDPNAFRDFLLYVYTAKIENFSEEDVVALHFIADKYDVKQLALQCLKFMMSNISIESFCDILTLALKYNESELITKAEQFFAKNLQEILPTVQWQAFLKENPTVANELFIKSAKRLKF